MENFNWETVLFLFLLLDSLGAVVLSFKGPLWWAKYLAPVAKYFPYAKGWSLLYFIFVLTLGYYMGIYN